MFCLHFCSSSSATWSFCIMAPVACAPWLGSQLMFSSSSKCQGCANKQLPFVLPTEQVSAGFCSWHDPVLFSCSILNKLTPEKFDKLCLELLNVGVDSKLVLKGIILLVSCSCVVVEIVIIAPSLLQLRVETGERGLVTQVAIIVVCVLF